MTFSVPSTCATSIPRRRSPRSTWRIWIADFCAAAPDRLFATAMVPLQNMDFTLEELQRVAKMPCFRGVFIRPMFLEGRYFTHPYYDPLWAELESLGLTATVHPTPGLWNPEWISHGPFVEKIRGRLHQAPLIGGGVGPFAGGGSGLQGAAFFAGTVPLGHPLAPILSSWLDNHMFVASTLIGFSDATPIRTHRLLREVRDIFPRETIYTVDGQLTLASGRQVLGSYTPASRLNSGSNGCMGVGVPFAIGAKLARPEVPVVSINGDCAFGFNAMELETAVRCKLPIVFIVNNNSGIVGSNLEARMGLPEGYEERVATYTPNIRYDKILEAFGGHTEHVVHPDDIRPALARAYQATKRGQVACVNVIADPQESMATRSQRAGALMGYGRE